MVDELATQSVPWASSLLEAEFGQPALASEHLRREFAAILTGHCALHTRDDGCAQRAIVLELLCAILNRDPRFLADEFVVGALVGVLKPSPPADVVNEDGCKCGMSASHISNQLSEGIASVYSE